jgi:hypothetical protein
MIVNATAKETQPSVTNPIRLSLQRVKPALLNAETAWKRPW